ncbi:hypothetical protein ACEPAI_7398 [Sanghuangporus weigelae]
MAPHSRCPACQGLFAQVRRHQQCQPPQLLCYVAYIAETEALQHSLGFRDDELAMEDDTVAFNGEDGEEDSEEEGDTSSDSEPIDEGGALREVVAERRAAQSRLQYHPKITQKFNDIVPLGEAGKEYSNTIVHDVRDGDEAHAKFAEDVRSLTEVREPHAPFASKMDWDFARWAKTRGPGSTAVDDLLKIEGVVESLGLSYRNSRELNAKIDKEIPTRRPAFQRREVTVGDITLEFFVRDMMVCIRALFAVPEFASQLILQPERQYVDDEVEIRVYHDMHTGDWWWDTQEAIEEVRAGGTVVPIIVSLDKMQVTLFRMKNVYPVYLTIGNISKDIRKKPSRHVQVLLAYLPTTHLTDIDNKTARRRMLLNLTHACLRSIFRKMGGLGGPGTFMNDGNGRTFRCHPILASVVLDYQEQVSVTGITTGDCAKCHCPNDRLGHDCWESYDERDMDDALNILDILDSHDPSTYQRVCKENRIKAIQHPFWINLPYCSIYNVITPDILHQLHQGVVKHLVEWLKGIVGAKQLDARCRRIPPNHSIRVFHMGLSILSRVTGKEHRQICQFLLGLLVGFKLTDTQSTKRLICATRALLDFMYIAQYPIHTDETLGLLQDALRRLHENKQVFIDTGVRENFNFVKMHSMVHYCSSIRLCGTTDNYNTQISERLHIDLTKDAYSATNKKDEMPQMMRWLERKEKVFDLTKNINWQTQPPHTNCPWRSPEIMLAFEVSTATKPMRMCSLEALKEKYGAGCFKEALKCFIVSLKEPNMRPNNVALTARQEIIVVRSVGVFERVKFHDRTSEGSPVIDSIHARAAKVDKQGRHVISRFDTALVRLRDGSDIQAFRVAQVQVIFSLNTRALVGVLEDGALQEQVPSRLAYVEWFSKFSARPDNHFRMYKVSRSFTSDGRREFGIIPVADLQRSAHLIPYFVFPEADEWTSEDVLEKCNDFYLNDFKDRSTHFSFF